MTSTLELLKDIFVPPETRSGRIRKRRERVVLSAAAVVLAMSMAWCIYILITSCGSPWSGVRRIDEECVGVTDGSYVFDQAFEDVQNRIARENAEVRDKASSYVTVALVDLLTPTDVSAKSVQNVRNELEGAYTAQHRINSSIPSTDSRPKIQLVLANWGSTEGQWRHVRDQLVEMRGGDDHLTAAIGLGVSTRTTQSRAENLSTDIIPMIGTLLTANELDYNRIPGFVRMSPTTLDYAKALGRYVAARNKAPTDDDLRSAALVYDMNSDSAGDLFTESPKNDLQQELPGLVRALDSTYFGASIPTPAGAGRFDLVTPKLCTAPPIDAVLYAGRRVDLPGFLDSLATRRCRDTPLTVITAADLGELLGRSQREQQLRAANLTVVYAGTSDAEGWGRNVEGTPPDYGNFLKAFKGHNFAGADLIDGQAIQMHDALQAAAKAISLATPADPSRLPTSGEVRGVLLVMNGAYAVQGAGGIVSFSARDPGAGNPTDKPVPVLSFPSPPDDPSGQQVVTPMYTTP